MATAPNDIRIDITMGIRGAVAVRRRLRLAVRWQGFAVVCVIASLVASLVVSWYAAYMLALMCIASQAISNRHWRRGTARLLLGAFDAQE